MRISKKEGESVSNQRKIIYEYIEKNKEFAGEDTEEFIDDGKSGKNMNRAEMIRLKEKIVSGEIKTVIAKDLSRIGRNYAEMGEFMEMMIPLYGVRVIAVNDALDSNYNDFSIVHILKCILNEIYIRDVSQKVRCEKRMKIENGKFTGGTELFGYVRENERYCVNEEEAEIIRFIFAKYCMEMSCGDIADLLNDRGINTPGGRKNNKAARWDRNSVSRILREESYCGYKICGKRCRDGIEVKKFDIFPKIIEKDIYYRAKNIREKRKSRKKN